MKSLFDLIAPIAIYHGADVLYKTKALAAIRELKRRVQARDQSLAGYGLLHPSILVENLATYLEFEEPARLPNIQDLYIKLFQEIVENEQPSWTCFFDRWGARAYKDENGQLVFSGDSSWCLPWFETEQLLRERIQEHVSDAVIAD